MRDGLPVGVLRINGQELEDVAVAPAWRRRGIGSAMVQYAQEMIGEPLFGDVLTENFRSRGMMERCGFARRPDFVRVRPGCVAYVWPTTATEDDRVGLRALWSSVAQVV
jgi:GNAT superfamily N-acetyltransferase